MPKSKNSYVPLPLEWPTSHNRARAVAHWLFSEPSAISEIFYWPAHIPGTTIAVDDCSHLVVVTSPRIAWAWITGLRPGARRRRAMRFDDAARALGGNIRSAFNGTWLWYDGAAHTQPMLDLYVMPPDWQSNCFAVARELFRSEGGDASQDILLAAGSAIPYNRRTRNFDTSVKNT